LVRSDQVLVKADEGAAPSFPGNQKEQ